MADSVSGGTPDAPRPAVWRRATSTAYVESSQRVVVLDLAHLDHPPYVFEGSAAQIWAGVDGDRSEAQIASHLAETFQAPVEEVSADVRQFVDRLREVGLVVGDDG
jgi:hypothetical protein